MAFSENFNEFFDTDDFAVEATHDGSTLLGILDREYVEVGNIEGEHPVFQCAESSVTTAQHGDTITIDGTAYTIVGIQPDGTGTVILVLQE